MTFVKTAKQIEAVRLLTAEPKYTLLFGGSRCLIGETLILTSKGYKSIKDIQIGELVPSLSLDNLITYKPVVNKYLVTGEQPRHKVITFVLSNNTKITCSHEHRLLFKGRYTEANIIARRTLERSDKFRRSLSSEQLRQISLNELLCLRQSYWQSGGDVSGTGRKRLSQNNDKSKRESYYCEDAQISCTALGRESVKQASDKSYRSQSEKQRSRQPGMGNLPGEYRSYDEGRPADNEQRREERHAHTDNGAGNFHKTRVYPTQGNPEDISGKIQLHGKLHKGCGDTSNLEAREISIKDIVDIKFSETSDILYDIEIEDNHNYFITGGNIISHNSGKSFIIIRQIILRALKEAGSRHLVSRFAFNHAKQSLWHDTIPKVLSLCFPGVKPIQNKSDWFLEFPNKSQIWLGGLDDKERTEKVLGNEYATLFINECSQVSYSSYSTLLTRLAQNTGLVNRVFLDCNPPSTAHWTYKLFVQHLNPDTNEAVDGKYYSHMRMNPDDNLENLPEDYIESVLNTLSHRQQKRFRYGEFLDDIEGALWTYDMIDKYRVNEVPELKTIVVGLDPSGTATQSSDEAGIVTVGIDFEGHGYVLDDVSGIYSPNQWGTYALRQYHTHEANRIVAEVNQGWDMVKTIIHNIDKEVRVISVAASRGKVARAEPVVALYERGFIHHVGVHQKLEDQMCSWDSRESLISPGRIDALVWGLTDLLCKKPLSWTVR